MSSARSLLRIARRYLLSHPVQSALMLLGISLGVAVAVSIDIANASAERAFELSTEAVTGRATHYISGGPSGLDEDLYTELRTARLGVPMAPVLSQFTTSPAFGDQALQLMGIDPLAEGPFRSYLGEANDSASIGLIREFFTQPGAILLSSQLAVQFDLQHGDTIELTINGQKRPAQIVGLIESRDAFSQRALENLILADIATVQEYTGQLGRLERIDLILPDDSSVNQAIRARLPQDASLLPSQGRSNAVQQMTGAFRTNLTALSLLGLLVGLFLIYNTMTFSVVQRRPIFGTLRALGVTGNEIFAMVLGEALLIGILGSALGLLLGILLGQSAVDLVSQTINDVFYTLTVREVGLPNSSLIKGSLLGVVATLLASVPPAWEAANSPARRTLSRAGLESLSLQLIKWAALLGLLLGAASAILLAAVDLNLTMSFLSTFGVVIGFALLSPWVTRFLVPRSAGLLQRLAGPLGRLAPREVATAASRTSVAMAALMVAVAVTIGVSLMVSSFRSSVVDWVNIILSNDIYVSVVGASLSEPKVAINPEITQRVEDWPGVEEVHLLRNVTVDSPYGPITVAANNNPNDGDQQSYVATEGNGQELWKAVKDGSVIISEPLANRLDLDLDDQIELYTDRGPRSFEIVAIFSDYTSSQGNVTMWLDNYRQLWEDQAVTAFSVGVEEGRNVDAMVADMRADLNAIQLLNIRSNESLRTETLVVFDRTFTITRALQVITTGVAFVGVLSAMLSLQLEKQRQLGILKAVGMTIRQTWTLVLLETGLIGLIAGLLALPTGYAIALILVRIINRRSFGWTLQMQLDLQPFALAMLIAIAAALLAGIYPAYRASRRRALEAIRFD